jgi:hypothetical protein
MNNFNYKFLINNPYRWLLGLLACIISLHVQSQESVELPQFTSIEIFGRVEVKVNYGNSESIRITGDSVHRNSVKYNVKDNCLNISLLSEFPPEIQIVVEVNCSKLERLSIGGGCKVYNRGAIEAKNIVLKVGGGSELDMLVQLDSANIKVSKGGFARLTGQCRSINLKTSTGGTFRATDLKNTNLNAVMKGGYAVVATSGSVKAKVRFNAILKYKGSPVSLKKDEGSGGSIVPLEEDETDE